MAKQRNVRRHFDLIDADKYFDIHGYKTSPEIFPGTPILAVNKEHHPEYIWWTIRDKSWDGRMADAINESLFDDDGNKVCDGERLNKEANLDLEPPHLLNRAAPTLLP